MCEICDVSTTSMTSCVGDVSKKLRKKCIVCLHCSKYKLSYIIAFFMKFQTTWLDDSAMIPTIR